MPNNKNKIIPYEWNDRFAWAMNHLKSLQETIESARYFISDLEKMKLFLQSVHNGISETNKLLEELRCDSCTFTSLDKYIFGQKLDRHDYLMLLLSGVLVFPGIEDAYNGFLNFFYKDDERQGYIDLEGLPPDFEFAPGKVPSRLRLGNEIVPEEVQISFLNPKQRTFFQKNYPAIYKRFRK